MDAVIGLWLDYALVPCWVNAIQTLGRLLSACRQEGLCGYGGWLVVVVKARVQRCRIHDLPVREESPFLTHIKLVNATRYCCYRS